MSLMKHMRYIAFALAMVSASAGTAVAAPLSSNARTVIPSAIQQMISVDYRELRNSPSARALKDRDGSIRANPLSASKPSVTLLSYADLTRVGRGDFVLFA